MFRSIIRYSLEKLETLPGHHPQLMSIVERNVMTAMAIIVRDTMQICWSIIVSFLVVIVCWLLLSRETFSAFCCYKIKVCRAHWANIFYQ